MSLCKLILTMSSVFSRNESATPSQVARIRRSSFSMFVVGALSVTKLGLIVVLQDFEKFETEVLSDFITLLRHVTSFYLKLILQS